MDVTRLVADGSTNRDRRGASRRGRCSISNRNLPPRNRCPDATLSGATHGTRPLLPSVRLIRMGRGSREFFVRLSPKIGVDSPALVLRTGQRFTVRHRPRTESFVPSSVREFGPHHSEGEFRRFVAGSGGRNSIGRALSIWFSDSSAGRNCACWRTSSMSLKRSGRL